MPTRMSGHQVPRSMAGMNCAEQEEGADEDEDDAADDRSAVVASLGPDRRRWLGGGARCVTAGRRACVQGRRTCRRTVGGALPVAAKAAVRRRRCVGVG